MTRRSPARARVVEAREGEIATKAARWRVPATVMVLALMAAFLVPTAHASSAPAGPAEPDELIVGYRQGSTPEQRAKARGRAGATAEERVVREGPNKGEVELVKLPRGKHRDTAIAELESDPAVAYAEPNWVYTKAATSNDPYYTDGSLWGMYGDPPSGDTTPLPPANQYGSQATEAWAGNHTGNESVVVGIIDEGVQVTHPDLVDNAWENPYELLNGTDDDGNGYVDDINGWDFVNNDNTVYDGGRKGTQDKHGTHVAGTIGARGGNGTGVAGVNWDVTMISAKFLGRRGGTLANAVKAVDYLTDLKTVHPELNVVATNNSWGGGGYSEALYDAIERANAANILFIAAAGNGGSDGVGDDNDVTPHYPSSYNNANVISVASITSDGAKSSFSNYGAMSVHLGAPGSGIYSTLPNDSYGSYSGTSMATPHVTGGAALYAASHSGATAADIKSAILTSTVDTGSLSDKTKTVTGGRLNVSGF